MRRLILHSVFLLVLGTLSFVACQKNTAPTQQILTEQEKTSLMAKMRADTLYKQWQENQKKGFQAMLQAVKTGKVDTAKLKAFKHDGNEADYIQALKDAGMSNAEEFNAINKRGQELLRELFKKYPESSKLSPDDFIELGKRTPLNKPKP